jgi:type 1 fimbria pilin
MKAGNIFLTGTLSVISLVGAPLVKAAGSTNTIHMKGYVTDTWCAVNRDTKPPTAACTRTCVRAQGAKYAFYDLGTGEIYVVQQQNEVEPFAGQKVEIQAVVRQVPTTVSTMRGERKVDTLSITSIQSEK